MGIIKKKQQVGILFGNEGHQQTSSLGTFESCYQGGSCIIGVMDTLASMKNNGKLTKLG